MLLTAPEHHTVFHVAQNMRAADRREIYGLRAHDNPFVITQEVMARPEVTWVGWWRGAPAIVFGGVEISPGVWSIHCFGTDFFNRLALPLTRFVRKAMLPMLFDTLGAHRLEADSHSDHVEAHRWMELCGASREGVKRARGRDGSDYFTYTIVKPLDGEKPQV